MLTMHIYIYIKEPGERPPEARGMSSDETYLTRSMPLIPPPAEV